jgi:hypothetical protein
MAAGGNELVPCRRETNVWAESLPSMRTSLTVTRLIFLRRPFFVSTRLKPSTSGNSGILEPAYLDPKSSAFCEATLLHRLPRLNGLSGKVQERAV